MTYEEYRQKKQEEVNALPIAFAYNDEQLVEGLHKLGLRKNQVKRVVGLPGGGFCRREDLQHVLEVLSYGKLPELMENDEQFAEEAFYYEMCNHEYALNWEGDYDVCECFGSCEYGDAKNGNDYLKEMGYSLEVRKAYAKAHDRYMKDAIDKEWF